MFTSLGRKLMAKKDKLPYSLEAEKAVLGAALIDNDAAVNIMSNIESADFFYFEKNQLIYTAMWHVKDQGQEINSVTVSSELDSMKVLEKIGGIEYLAECSDSMVALSSLKSYLDVVIKFGSLRKMLVTIRNIDAAYCSDDISIENVDDFINQAERDFRDALDSRKVSNFTHADVVAKQMQEKLNQIKETPDNAITGLTTGYPKLDSYTDGFRPGEVTILAARPNLGKTALALNIAFNASTRGHTAVAIFSLEMATTSIFTRMISAASCVPCKRIERGQLSNGADRANVAEGIKAVGNADIYFDETPGIKLNEIVAKTRQLNQSLLAKDGKKLGLVIIDYLGLIQLGGRPNPNQSRQEEVRKISLRLKEMAKELEIPLLVLSQFSRDVEKRGDKPKMSDLRDSGNLEQDADVVILLHRDDYQKESKAPINQAINKYGDKKPNQLSMAQRFEYLRDNNKLNEVGIAANAESGKDSVSLVEVIVGKNRNGATGSTFLLFHKDIQKYYKVSDEVESKLRNFSNEFERL